MFNQGEFVVEGTSLPRKDKLRHSVIHSKSTGNILLVSMFISKVDYCRLPLAKSNGASLIAYKNVINQFQIDFISKFYLF